MEYNYKIVPLDFEYTIIQPIHKYDDLSFFAINNNNQRIYKIFKNRLYCIDITENWQNILETINNKVIYE
jgi:hypothetical protein